MKICSKCKSPKNKNDFSTCQFIAKYSVCRICVRSYKAKYRQNTQNSKDKIYYDNNKSRILKQTTKYNLDNKSQIIECKKEYYRNNKAKILNYNNFYKKDRRKSDPLFKLRENVSASVRQALRLGGKSGKSILSFLPYSFSELRKHLESLFEPWMNWNNWGKYDSKTWDNCDSLTWAWQIDHIIPQSILLYSSMEDENFKKCWSLDNLRPLSAKINILDGNRRGFND